MGTALTFDRVGFIMAVRSVALSLLLSLSSIGAFARGATPVPSKPVVSVTTIQSVVLLFGKRPGGLVQATGIVVDADRKWIVTASHFWSSVEQPGVLEPMIENGKLISAPSPYMNRYLHGEAAIPRLVWADPASDLALLVVPGLTTAHTMSLRRDVPAAGDELRVLGNPSSRNAMWQCSQATMLQEKWTEWTYETGQHVYTNAFEIDVADELTSGFSGGPVLDGKDELVGMTIASARPDGRSAYAVGAATIRRFLGRALDQEAWQSALKADWKNAKRLVNLAVAMDARDPWGYVVRARISLAQGRFPDARDDLQEALRCGLFLRTR